eukprot:c14823_g1_i1.p1 GENE.c14823_g1_i1~~c14823_g1_i1.p1  ORF type:complete len:469 (+),score=103.98 c14823_g1_i1:572-1978(+)
MALKCGDWAYRAEGTRNIVFCYIGDDENFQGTVLRVLKRMTSNQQPPSGHEYFGEVLFRQALPSLRTWGCPERIVELSEAVLQGLNEQCKHQRPEALRSNQIDTCQSFGLLMVDLTGNLENLPPIFGDLNESRNWALSTVHFNPPAISDAPPVICGAIQHRNPRAVGVDEIESASVWSGSAQIRASAGSEFQNLMQDGGCCVEIKPKCGYLRQGSLVCAFCALQHFKHTTRHITHVTQYCPLELFSGEFDRIFHTLHHLVTNPQNNLRLFKDGADILPSSVAESDMSRILQAVATVLTNCSVLNDLLELQRLNEHSPTQIRLIAKELVSRGVLDDRYNVVADFDSWAPWWIRNRAPPILDFENFDLERWRLAIDRWCKMPDAPSGDVDAATDDLIASLSRFLLSKCGMDVSVMVFLRDSPVSSSLHFRVCLVDVVPKSLSKIDFYEKHEREVAQAYQSAVDAANNSQT